MKKITKIVTFYDDGTFTESVPYIGAPFPSVPINPQPYNPFPSVETKPTCPKCGLVCEGAMGYVCPNNPCPMGMGGVWCNTTGNCV